MKHVNDELTIKIFCAECENKMKMEIKLEPIRGDLTLECKPCPHCMETIGDEKYDQGYEQGYEGGYEVGCEEGGE